MNAQTITINTENFSKTVGKGYALLDFWAPWCPDCRRIGPAFDKITAECADKLKAGKVNTDDFPEFAGKYGIRSIPTLILFKDGEPVSQIVGPDSKAAIDRFIREHIGQE